MSDQRHYKGCTRAFSALMLAHAVVSAEIEKALGESVSLSLNEFDALVALDGQGHHALPLSALCDVVRLSQPAVSRLVDRLEKRGLVVRREGGKDRRSVAVEITPCGMTLLQRAIPVHDRCIHEKLLNRLTPEESDILRSALLKIADEHAPLCGEKKA